MLPFTYRNRLRIALTNMSYSPYAALNREMSAAREAPEKCSKLPCVRRFETASEHFSLDYLDKVRWTSCRRRGADRPRPGDFTTSRPPHS
jgi:hypothetical protein